MVLCPCLVQQATLKGTSAGVLWLGFIKLPPPHPITTQWGFIIQSYFGLQDNKKKNPFAPLKRSTAQVEARERLENKKQAHYNCFKGYTV